MSSKKSPTVHTVAKANHWENSVNGRSTGIEHRTQRTAAEAGREIAIRKHAEHSIHRKDGTVGQKNSYGNDPRDIKG